MSLHRASIGGALRRAVRNHPVRSAFSTTCWLGMALAISAPAIGQTAGMMSFQGLLRDAGGSPVSGSVTMQLQIVDSLGAVQDASGNSSVGPEDTFTVT